MSPLAYHALWLSLVLAAVAVASAALTRHLLGREWRRIKAEELLDALAGYAEWVAVQRRAPVFQVDLPGRESPLKRARALCSASFPELAGEMDELLDLDAQLLRFLQRQDELRLRDPELWLESDHDRRFMALWAAQRAVVHRLADQLRRAARPAIDPEPESIYPA